MNQGTLMTRSSLRHKFLYRNSGLRTKMGELIILNWMVMERKFDNLAEHVRQHLRYVGSRLSL